MKKITSTTELKEAIFLLEIKQANTADLLKEEIKCTYENLRPVNLIKNTLRDLTSAPDLKGELLNATMSLAVGFLSKKILVGATANPLKQLLGTILQVAVTSIAAKNADGIKSMAHHLINNIITKKDTKTS